jgi:hypothetical protein
MSPNTSTCTCSRWDRRTKKPFGNLDSFEEMARGYSYILYTVFESEEVCRSYEEHPAHTNRCDECFAVWIGDAPESALVFDFRRSDL